MSNAIEVFREYSAPVAGVATGIVTAAVGVSPATGIALGAAAAAGSVLASYTGQRALAAHLRAGAVGVAAGTAVAAIVEAVKGASRASQWPVTSGASILLWGDLRDRVSRLGGVIERTQPQVLIIHGNDQLDAELVASLRRLAPRARYLTEQWVNGPDDVNSALERARRSAGLLGSEGVVWNVEAPWKNTGLEGRRAAQRLLSSWTTSPQGFTAYAMPTLHSAFPWAAFCGGRDETGSYDLACAFSLPQVYPFGDDKGRSDREFAPSGLIQRTMRRGIDSWATAVSRGLIRQSVKTAPMLPGAWVRAEDELEALGLAGSAFPVPPFATWFAWHGVIDADAEQVISRFRDAS